MNNIFVKIEQSDYVSPKNNWHLTFVTLLTQRLRYMLNPQDNPMKVDNRKPLFLLEVLIYHSTSSHQIKSSRRGANGPTSQQGITRTP
jgi:hypothetical protein